MPPITIDLSNPEFNYAQYAEQGPVHRWTSPNGQSGWIIVGWPETRAALTNTALAKTPAAMAGYPAVTVPAGYLRGLPVGVTFMGPAYGEPVLIRLAYAFEQATKARVAPRYPESVDPQARPCGGAAAA